MADLTAYDVIAEFDTGKTMVYERKSGDISGCINKVLSEAVFYKDIEGITVIDITEKIG